VWARKKTCSRKKLESFLGRAFLRELFSLLHRVKQSHHMARFSSGARADLMWWKFFLQHWSGHSFFPPPSITHHVFSDASGLWGCGGFTEDVGWFQVPWPSIWQDVDISVKELVPDAITLVSVHISTFASIPTTWQWLRYCRECRPNIPPSHTCCVVFHSSVPGFHFHFTSRHVPGVSNIHCPATRHFMLLPLYHRSLNFMCPTMSMSAGSSSQRCPTGARRPGRTCFPACW
jgi:hypothetical protein